MSPWLAVLLVDRGWTSSAASLALAGLPAGRLLIVPMWAWIADRYGADPVVRLGLALSAVGALALVGTTGPWPAYGAMLAWGLARSPPLTVVDATTMATEGRGYGRIRSVGSLAYLLVSAANGLLRESWPNGPVVVATVLAVAVLVLAYRLPALAPAPRADLRVALRGLVLHPVLVPLVGVSVLHGAALTVYETLFAVHVSQLGFGSTVTGAALALGVLLEVAVLAFGRPLLDRVGPVWLLGIAVGATIPRFAITALAPGAAWMVAAQALHGLNFGCWWLAATSLISDHAPPGLRHSAQALLPTAAFGSGPLVGLGLASVVLADQDTRALFLWATALPVVGLALVGWLARRLRG